MQFALCSAFALFFDREILFLFRGTCATTQQMFPSPSFGFPATSPYSTPGMPSMAFSSAVPSGPVATFSSSFGVPSGSPAFFHSGTHAAGHAMPRIGPPAVPSIATGLGGAQAHLFATTGQFQSSVLSPLAALGGSPFQSLGPTVNSPALEAVLSSPWLPPLLQALYTLRGHSNVQESGIKAKIDQMLLAAGRGSGPLISAEMLAEADLWCCHHLDLAKKALSDKQKIERDTERDLEGIARSALSGFHIKAEEDLSGRSIEELQHEMSGAMLEDGPAASAFGAVHRPAVPIGGGVGAATKQKKVTSFAPFVPDVNPSNSSNSAWPGQEMIVSGKKRAFEDIAGGGSGLSSAAVMQKSPPSAATAPVSSSGASMALLSPVGSTSFSADNGHRQQDEDSMDSSGGGGAAAATSPQQLHINKRFKKATKRGNKPSAAHRFYAKDDFVSGDELDDDDDGEDDSDGGDSVNNAEEAIAHSAAEATLLANATAARAAAAGAKAAVPTTRGGRKAKAAASELMMSAGEESDGPGSGAASTIGDYSSAGESAHSERQVSSSSSYSGGRGGKKLKTKRAKHAALLQQRTVHTERGKQMAPAIAEKLMAWFLKNIHDPFPSPEEKGMLMAQTGLDSDQLRNWFTNCRKRHLSPLQNGRAPRSQLELLMVATLKAGTGAAAGGASSAAGGAGGGRAGASRIDVDTGTAAAASVVPVASAASAADIEAMAREAARGAGKKSIDVNALAGLSFGPGAGGAIVTSASSSAALAASFDRRGAAAAFAGARGPRRVAVGGGAHPFVGSSSSSSSSFGPSTRFAPVGGAEDEEDGDSETSEDDDYNDEDYKPAGGAAAAIDKAKKGASSLHSSAASSRSTSALPSMQMEQDDDDDEL
jgi:Homeobox KN domain